MEADRLAAAAVQGMLKLNVAQGIADSLNVGEFMGRCMIDVGKFARQPNCPVDDWCAARLHGLCRALSMLPQAARLPPQNLNLPFLRPICVSPYQGGSRGTGHGRGSGSGA